MSEKSEMQRWKLTLAYDGQPHGGWQSQPGGNTVQDYLEAALARMRGMPQGTRVHASGRTDAGVHALGQVAHVDAPRGLTLDAESWPRALNARLPASIRVLKVEAVSPDFHARFSALEKTYEYRIYVGRILPPFLAGRQTHAPHPLDLEVLRTAIAHVSGRHDFRAFAANRGPGSPPPRSTVRTMTEATVLQPAKDELYLRFTADGFLYRMVRMLAGTLLRVAQGQWSIPTFLRLLEGPEEEKTSACAPADGLYLMGVRYPHEPETCGG